MYARLPAESSDSSIAASAFAELDVDLRQDESGMVLEVSTPEKRLFREFHRFAGLLAEDFELTTQTAAGAFNSAIHRWQEFTSRRKALTEEQQTGLYGELLLLDALLGNWGTAALKAWIGRDAILPGRHDFRIGATDVEVKTTRSLMRSHFIHGLQQLEPAPGHLLFILSIRVESAGLGEGSSLKDQVAQLRSRLERDQKSLQSFEQKLASARYDNADGDQYIEPFILADSPRLIPVNEECPRIVPTMIEGQLSEALAARIDQLSYRVNLEGLGVSEGERVYDEVLNGVRLSRP